MRLGKTLRLDSTSICHRRIGFPFHGNNRCLARKAIPTAGRTPFGPTVRKKNFFIRFKAGKLLKTRESQTKYANFERLFRRKCVGSARFVQGSGPSLGSSWALKVGIFTIDRRTDCDERKFSSDYVYDIKQLNVNAR
jgi:hypothetical protein